MGKDRSCDGGNLVSSEAPGGTTGNDGQSLSGHRITLPGLVGWGMGDSSSKGAGTDVAGVGGMRTRGTDGGRVTVMA